LSLGPKNVKVTRPLVTGYVSTREDYEKYSNELFDMVISGKVEVKVFKTYELQDVAQSHLDLEGRKTTGKLLLKCD
jgi:NADPH:quinone reductase